MMTKKPPKPAKQPTKIAKKPAKPRPSRRIDPEKNQQGQGGGRPMVVFDAKMTSEVERLAAMLTVAQMGDYFGCGETTMHEVFKRQPEVSEAYHRGRAKITGAIAQNLIQKAMAGDYQSQSLYLRTQAGWSETTKLDHTSSDKSMSPREMTDEELEAELAKYGIKRNQ
jgi:hypothetical protein